MNGWSISIFRKNIKRGAGKTNACNKKPIHLATRWNHLFGPTANRKKLMKKNVKDASGFKIN